MTGAAAVIREVLSVYDYLLTKNHTLLCSGASHRGPCPFCGGSEWSSKFVATGPLYHCWACEAGGDVIRLCEKLERISFGQAVEKLGEISGVDVHNIDAFDAIKTSRAGLSHAGFKTQGRQELAAQRAHRIWNQLALTSVPGLSYCMSRGITEETCGDVLRFSDMSCCVPLTGFQGTMVNIIARDFKGGAQKIKSIKGACGVGFFCKDSAPFGEQNTGKAIICEGVFDYLTFYQEDHEMMVIGAHGVSNIKNIAAACLSANYAEINLMCHNDTAGRTACAAAKKLLKKKFGTVSIVSPPPPHSDFNDWFCATK